MTIGKLVWVFCDGPDCNEHTPDGDGETTARDARWHARREGWLYSGGRDFCSRACSAKWRDAQRATQDHQSKGAE